MTQVGLTSLTQKIVNLHMGPRNKNKPDSQVMKKGYILHAHYGAKYEINLENISFLRKLINSTILYIIKFLKGNFHHPTQDYLPKKLSHDPGPS